MSTDARQGAAQQPAQGQPTLSSCLLLPFLAFWMMPVMAAATCGSGSKERRVGRGAAGPAAGSSDCRRAACLLCVQAAPSPPAPASCSPPKKRRALPPPHLLVVQGVLVEAERLAQLLQALLAERQLHKGVAQEHGGDAAKAAALGSQAARAFGSSCCLNCALHNPCSWLPDRRTPQAHPPASGRRRCCATAPAPRWRQTAGTASRSASRPACPS